MKKKFIISLISVAAIIAVMAFGFAGCDGVNAIDPNAYSFVTIDINPSIELITLGNNVIEVKAANYDACVLLEGEDFSSMTLEEATTKIVALADEMGYLNDTNNEVKITVISDDANAEEILKNQAKSAAEKASKKAVATTQTRLQDELTVKKLKEEQPDKFADLTEEKARLIESVMEYNPSMTYEIGVDMTIKELSDALKTALKDNTDIFTSELRGEYSARYAARKQEIEREIAAVYGAEYLDEWEKYTALENIYNSIATALEKSGLSDEDIARVQELLSIGDVSLIQKGGVVKPEYVLNYIDKHIAKKSSQVDAQALDEVIAILNSYDANNYELTQEELALIAEVVGEDAEYTLLSDLETDLSERKAQLEALKESTDLTDEQIAQIRELKEEFSSIKESVLDGMQDIIAATRAQIAAEKQSRGNN